MRVKIDAVGRIVIPKRLRQHLGIASASDVEVVVDGDGLRILPTEAIDREFETIDGFPSLAPTGSSLTVDAVRDLIDNDRDRHVGS